MVDVGTSFEKEGAGDWRRGEERRGEEDT